MATAPAALKLVERYKLRAPMIRAMAAVLAGEVTMRDAAETHLMDVSERVLQSMTLESPW